MDDFADRFLEIASVSTPLAVTVVIVDDREKRCLILFFSFKRRPSTEGLQHPGAFEFAEGLAAGADTRVSAASSLGYDIVFPRTL